jgi:hypothetical protein
MSLRKQLFLSVMVAMLAGVIATPAQFIRGVNDRQVRTVLERLETKTDQFRSALDRRMDNTRLNNTVSEDNIAEIVAEFENATDDLRNNFNTNRSTANHAETVLNSGWYIDNFMRSNRLGANVERQWTSIRTDLNTLARYYNVSWNWNRTLPPWRDRVGRDSYAGRLTGTYRLNTRLSDNVRTVVNRAITGSGTAVERRRRTLERRLASPQEIAIEARGNQVEIGTNLSDRGVLVAEGRAVTETNARGRSTRTTVSMQGNTLTVNTEGDRTNDFWVSFTPVGNNRLRVTRRIYLEGRNEMVTSNSVYDRTAEVARWPVVDRRPRWNNNNNAGNAGDFHIPNGTRLTATLQNRIATGISQVGDRFTMRVTEPARYRGAIISGRVIDADSSGRISGRANIGLDFESIRVGSRTYSFAGIIDSAREVDGDVINVSNEGDVRDSNQTTRTVTRAGIGAVVGALIGAIAGGGDGAAIGAGIGAGAGAGSVLIQGRDNIDLQSGSEFTITATGPSNVVGRQ